MALALAPRVAASAVTMDASSLRYWPSVAPESVVPAEPDYECKT